MKFVLVVVLLAFGASACAPEPRPVDRDLQRHKDALSIISEFSDSLCKDVPLEGGVSKTEIVGNAEADLTGVIARVAGLGFDAAVDYEKAGYTGVLQSDLAKAFNDSRDCRIRIYEELREKLLTDKPSAISIIEDNGIKAYCKKLISGPSYKPPFSYPSESVRANCPPGSFAIACRYWKDPVFDHVGNRQQAIGPHMTDGACTCTCTTEDAENTRAPEGSCQCFPAVICAANPVVDPSMLEEVSRIAVSQAATCR